jgi:hypothetical protein
MVRRFFLRIRNVLRPGEAVIPLRQTVERERA